MNRVPPKAAPYSRTGDEWIKRARTSPPRGASRPRFLRATGPPQGLLPAGTLTPKARWGTRVACVGSCVGFGIPVEVPESGRGEVVLRGRGVGLRSLPAQQQAPKALPHGRQLPHALEVPTSRNCGGGSWPGGDDPPVTRSEAK